MDSLNSTNGLRHEVFAIPIRKWGLPKVPERADLDLSSTTRDREEPIR